MSDTSHGMTNEEMHAELVDGITIANGELFSCFPLCSATITPGPTGLRPLSP